MECEKVRDRFSALLEGDISLSEEKAVREHLSSCSDCRRDLEQFNKTVHWLHSVEDVEVPDGFLSDVQRKIEDRNKTPGQGAIVKKSWLNYPIPFKLPIQAVAMVAILFLVVYLTKMVPYERPSLKEVEQTKPLRSEAKKVETESVPKEMERVAQKPPPETVQQPSVSAEKRSDTERTQKVIQEERKTALPLPKAEVMRAEKPLPEASGKAKSPFEQEEREKQEMASRAKESPHEITLRVSDRGKTLSQLHELIKQSGGEIVRTEENILLASMPVGSLSKFEKDLAEFGLPKRMGEISPQKDVTERVGAVSALKRRDSKEKEGGL